MKRRYISSCLILILVVFSQNIYSQEDSTSCASKKRLQISGLPVVAYDADMGFQYGLVGNLFLVDSTVVSPEYKHALKIEWSRYTKGSGVNQVFYDSNT